MAELSVTTQYPPPRRSDRRRRGFTLLELLVVMGIVALLLGILFPVLASLGQLRDQARCAANLNNVGMGVWGFAMDQSGSLPEHHTGSDAPFDTMMMRTDDLTYVNLGDVLGYVSQPEVLYCPTQTEATSPALAFNGPGNRFDNLPGNLPPMAEGHPGKAFGIKRRVAPHSFDLPEGINASFPARSLLDPGPRPLAWAARNFSNKVIYSDFVGVHNWQGQGRFEGMIRAPHRGRGYNRLFGDGGVQWVDAEDVEAYRKISNQLPTAEELRQYYELLDVLP